MSTKNNKGYYRQYYTKNKKHIQKYQKRWYANNTQLIKEKSWAYRERTKDKIKAYHKLYSRTHRNEILDYQRKWCKRNKNVIAGYHRMRKYGISHDEFLQLHKAQNNKCAICLLAKPLSVDHHHKSGQVRSLLCFPCNSAIGLFYENPELMQRAIDYLHRHETPSLRILAAA